MRRLLPSYKEGTLKKVLVAFASVGVTGAVIRYKTHSQRQQLEGPPVQDEPEEDRSLAWYLQASARGRRGS